MSAHLLPKDKKNSFFSPFGNVVDVMFSVCSLRLPLSVVDCSQFLGICALPGKMTVLFLFLFLPLCCVILGKIHFYHWISGCKYKEIRRNLQRDVGKRIFNIAHKLLFSTFDQFSLKPLDRNLMINLSMLLES